jgi:hypothetical protein
MTSFMKTLLFAVTPLLTAPVMTNAQTTPSVDLAQRVRQLEDRATLKALVDTFSVLADRKDVQQQTLLFTEDATVDSYSGGQLVSSLKGRKEIGDTFGAYLAGFTSVYHMNGQQTLALDGDRATGTSYCLVVLIGPENGKTIKQTSGVYYDDEYVRRGGKWLIARRVSHFAWRDRDEVAQPQR